MSKYDRFEDFMQTVINEADSKCQRRHHVSLAYAYESDASIVTMISKIIDNGWYLLIALTAILVLGPLAFGVAVGAFVLTPPGMIIVGLLTVFGGIAAVRVLYKNRSLPLAVKSIGTEYEDRFKSHVNDRQYIDRLIDQASDALLRKASRSYMW